MHDREATGEKQLSSVAGASCCGEIKDESVRDKLSHASQLLLKVSQRKERAL